MIKWNSNHLSVHAFSLVLVTSNSWKTEVINLFLLCKRIICKVAMISHFFDAWNFELVVDLFSMLHLINYWRSNPIWIRNFYCTWNKAYEQNSDSMFLYFHTLIILPIFMSKSYALISESNYDIFADAHKICNDLIECFHVPQLIKLSRKRKQKK